jgi:hypothetical protein
MIHDPTQSRLLRKGTESAPQDPKVMLMRPICEAYPNVRAIYGEAIARLLDGNMKDEKNPNGWTYIEQLARDMFLNPKMAAELAATARLPAIRASIERANALNAPKQAIIDRAERCKKLGGYYREGVKGPVFYLDLPYQLHQLDPDWHGEHVYLPTNRNHHPIGEDRDWCGSYDSYASRAWHFRRDPHEIEGGWGDGRLYFYTSADVRQSDRAFLASYRDRLRRVLAEAVRVA